MLELKIPENVSEIITKHIDELALAIVGSSELEELIDHHIDGCLRGEISPSYLVKMTHLPGSRHERNDIHVLGEHVSLKNVYITSRVMAVSPDLKQVQTYSGSIYNISDIKVFEPPQNLILHLCAALHSWRLGQYFGVLHVFY
ncbi:hypothetical protein [Terasakiella pusilla]|uniref:hypothetical protein n=1 Tax=Terasakiella pusilla TaxID=64973 RepID=UPI003AA974AB